MLFNDDKFDLGDFLDRIAKMYKELPNYLKTPTKKAKYNLSDYGKNLLEKVETFLKKKW